MPTVKVLGPYRVFFYSADGAEPAHVHVQRENKVAKFWLTPVRAAKTGGFTEPELRRIALLLQESERALVERWNEFFEDSD